MTAQIMDSVAFRGSEYALAGVNGDRLFEPQELGLTPIPASTGCYRGYHCGYSVIDDSLLLTRVAVFLYNDNGPRCSDYVPTKLWGITPHRTHPRGHEYV